MKRPLLATPWRKEGRRPRFQPGGTAPTSQRVAIAFRATTVNQQQHRLGLSRLEPASDVAHGHAPRHYVGEIRIVGRQERFFAGAEGMHNTVAGKYRTATSVTFAWRGSQCGMG